MTQCCGKLVYQGLCVRGRPVEVMDCALCGYKHLHPKPTDKELAAYYQSRYFETEKPDYAKTSGTESEYQFLVDKAKIGAAQERPQMDGVGVAQCVLDFGCGPSAPFLKHWVKLLGYKKYVFYGVEPSIMAVRGWSDYDLGGCTATVYPSLEAGFSKTTKFDVIHLGFVLEHVTNPHEILLKLKDRLAPGGRLIVEVPNDFNPLQTAIWHRDSGAPWWISSPDHVNYLDWDSLRKLFMSCGLVLTEWGYTYPVEFFLLHGLDFRKDAAAKKAVVEKRAELQEIWQGLGPISKPIGRTVWVVAQERRGRSCE